MKNKNTLLSASAFALFSLAASNAYADQVINDDLIISFSACIGNDCVNGENFGFDTLRLKENNLRIKFQDTSSSASFPTNDWELVANDSTNGGGNYFAIRDVDGGRTPFTVEASAPSHSLYVDDGGRVGLGTAAPVVELHVVDGDSPTLRLEQDGSSGFTPQTWDVAGNETNFFVRDATNGSKLPFRIRPSAPDDSLYIDTDGGVGLGTDNPSGRFEVKSGGDSLFNVSENGLVKFQSSLFDNDSSDCAGFFVCGRFTSLMTLEETNEESRGRMILNMKNNGASWLGFENTALQEQWMIINSSDSLNFTFAEFATQELRVPLKLFNNGDVNMAGTLYANSSRHLKENISEVKFNEVLELIQALPVYTWNYIENKDENKHMGPMAQDFYRLFGLGKDNEHISSLDVNGVSLAAIRALYTRVKELEAEMALLKKR